MARESDKCVPQKIRLLTNDIPDNQYKIVDGCQHTVAIRVHRPRPNHDKLVVDYSIPGAEENHPCEPGS